MRRHQVIVLINARLLLAMNWNGSCVLLMHIAHCASTKSFDVKEIDNLLNLL